MTIIDRYVLRQFFQNVVVCFVSLMGLYVVLHAFSNMEAFLQYAKGLELLKVMIAYYGYQSFFFFDVISPLLVLMSAMFTMAWIQRHNELTALMAAGVSRIRVATPVLIAAATITVLAAANREMVIPKVKDQLAMRPADLKGNVIEDLQPQYDNASDVLIRGRHLIMDECKIEKPEFIVPTDPPHAALRVYGNVWHAAAAYFRSAKNGRPGGYLLVDVQEPRELMQRATLTFNGRPVLLTPRDNPAWLKPNEAFFVSDVTLDELTSEMMMRQYASTGELIWGLKHRSLYFSPEVRVMIHSRIVQPFLDISLLFLGLPLVVSRDNRNVFKAIGLCMAVVALFFAVTIVCQKLGASMLLRPPSLAAWMPLMLFVPAAAGMAESMWER